jgi:hypothetical protein
MTISKVYDSLQQLKKNLAKQADALPDGYAKDVAMYVYSRFVFRFVHILEPNDLQFTSLPMIACLLSKFSTILSNMNMFYKRQLCISD